MPAIPQLSVKPEYRIQSEDTSVQTDLLDDSHPRSGLVPYRLVLEIIGRTNQYPAPNAATTIKKIATPSQNP